MGLERSDVGRCAAVNDTLTFLFSAQAVDSEIKCFSVGLDQTQGFLIIFPPQQLNLTSVISN